MKKKDIYLTSEGFLELETELKITKEKIEDAKAENAKEKKYQLMRIENELEKEIFRIKHGMKYF